MRAGGVPDLELAGAKNRWTESTVRMGRRKRLPHKAVLAALHLQDPFPPQLSDDEWREALEFSDRSQLTLALRRAARQAMPDWVRERVDRNFADNAERLETLLGLYRDLTTRFEDDGIEYAALKGLTHCRDFGSVPENRTQYDIDLFIPPGQMDGARDQVCRLGFESIESMESSPTDHIPALIRKTGWEWRGNFFDPEMPLAVELHFRFWNGEMERLPAPGTEAFWERRVVRDVAGLRLTTLCLADALGFASLHVLKHILHGSGRPFHLYELACFLDSHAGDESFWRSWSGLHSPELRRLEAVVFRMATEWFGCRNSATAEAEMDALPAGTKAWFEEFATAPAGRAYRPRKDELWLHLSLVSSRRDAWSVARRRLFPGRLPGQVDGIYLPELGFWRRVLKQLRYVSYLATRLRLHVWALGPTLWSGVRWWRKRLAHQ